MICGVGHRLDSDLVLLWLWCGLAASIQLLAWALPYAAVTALKRLKKKAQKLDKSTKMFSMFKFLLKKNSFLSFSRAAPAAYEGSQARGLNGAVAAGLHDSHSNARSEPHLLPTPQLRQTYTAAHDNTGSLTH